MTENGSQSLPERIEREIAELCGLTKDQLREQLADALKLTAHQLVRVAAIVRELERQGDDLSGLRLGMMAYIRRIAYGQLLPEAVVMMQGHPLLLRRFSALPMPDQERLLKDKAVPVAEAEMDDERRVPLLELARDEIHQVFGDGELRSPDQQRNYLRTHQPRRRQRQRVEENGVILDRDAGGIRVGGVLIPRRDLARYLAELSE